MWFVKQHTYIYRIHPDKYRLCLAPNLLLQLICYVHYLDCRCSRAYQCYLSRSIGNISTPFVSFSIGYNSIIRRTRTRNEEEMNIRNESFPLWCGVWLWLYLLGFWVKKMMVNCRRVFALWNGKECVKYIVGWLMSFSLDLCPAVNKLLLYTMISFFLVVCPSLIQLLGWRDIKSYKALTYTNTFANEETIFFFLFTMKMIGSKFTSQ